MACEPIKTGDGLTAIICGRSKRRVICHYCRNVATFQCDHPVFRNNKKGTCDTWMCPACRNSIGPDQDLCRPHFDLWRNNGQKFMLGGIEVKS